MNTMSCFISGGAGFIGSHLVDKLIVEGCKVTVFDNLSSGRKDFLSQHSNNPSFKLIQGDLLEIDTLKKAMKAHDVVFHLAANPDARRGIEDTSLDLKLETIATYNVLESMRVNKIDKIVFSSSGTIYGETPVIPLPENYGPVLPISLYGAGKLACEGLISAFCSTFDMQAWIFRFANIVGSRTTHGVIYDFINKLKRNPHELEILGDGTQCKPYLHVSDCVNAILFAYKKANDRINVYNIGVDTSTNVKTIAEILIQEMKLTDVKIKYTGGDRGWPGDVPQVRFNTEKMRKLGWQASRSSNDAVIKTIKEILPEFGIGN